MKIVMHYSDDFKREVVQHYLSSDDSMQKTADNVYNASHWATHFAA